MLPTICARHTVRLFFLLQRRHLSALHLCIYKNCRRMRKREKQQGSVPTTSGRLRVAMTRLVHTHTPTSCGLASIPSRRLSL